MSGTRPEEESASAEKKPEVQKNLSAKELEQQELRDKQREAHKRFTSVYFSQSFGIKRVDGNPMTEEIEEDARLDGEGLQYDVKPGWFDFQFKDKDGKLKDEIHKIFLDEKGHVSSPNQSIDTQRAKMETYKLAGQYKLVLSFPNAKTAGDYSLDRVEKIVNEAVKAGVAIRIGDAALMERLSDPRFYDNMRSPLQKLLGKPGQRDRIMQQIKLSQQNLANNKELNSKLEAVEHVHHSEKLQTRATEVKAAAVEIVKGVNVEKLPQQLKALESAVGKTQETLSDIKTLLAKGSPTTHIAAKYQVELEKIEKEIKDLKKVLNDKDNVDKPGVSEAVKKLDELERTVVDMKKVTKLEATDPEARLKEKLDELDKSKAELMQAKTAVVEAADDKAKAAAIAKFAESVKEVRNNIEVIASDCKKSDYREETKSGSLVGDTATKTSEAIAAVKEKVGADAFKAVESDIQKAETAIHYSKKEVEILNDPVAASKNRIEAINKIADPVDAKTEILAEQRLLHSAIDRFTALANNVKPADVEEFTKKFDNLKEQYSALSTAADKVKGTDPDFAKSFKEGEQLTQAKARELGRIIEGKESRAAALKK